jgi:hypothetical protein
MPSSFDERWHEAGYALAVVTFMFHEDVAPLRGTRTAHRALTGARWEPSERARTVWLDRRKTKGNALAVQFLRRTSVPCHGQTTTAPPILPSLRGPPR